jgi:hypothetical protein
MPDDTVEGAALALAVGPTLTAWCANGRLDPDTVPLSRALVDAICHDHTVRDPLAAAALAAVSRQAQGSSSTYAVRKYLRCARKSPVVASRRERDHIRHLRPPVSAGR